MLNGNGFAIEEFGSPSAPTPGSSGPSHHRLGGPDEGITGSGMDMRMNGSSNGSSMLMDAAALGLGGMDRATPTASTSTGLNAIGANGGAYNAIFGAGRGGTVSSGTSPAGGLAFGNLLSPRMQDAVTDLFPNLLGGGGSKSDNNMSALRSTSDLLDPSVFRAGDLGGGSGASGGGPSSSSLPSGGGIGQQQGPLNGGLENLLEPEPQYAGRTAQSTRVLTAEEAYRTVTKPYPYAQSYHYLVKHLKDR